MSGFLLAFAHPHTRNNCTCQGSAELVFTAAQVLPLHTLGYWTSKVGDQTQLLQLKVWSATVNLDKLHFNMPRKMIIAWLVLLHTQFSCLCSISGLSRQAGRLCLRPGITLWILIRAGSAQFPGQVSKGSSKPWEASAPWMRDNGPPAALLSGSLWLPGSTKANISEKRARRHRQALTAKPKTKSG